MQIVCLPAKTRAVEGLKKTPFRPDNDVVYVQPPRALTQQVRAPYRPRTIRIEANTTYTTSYLRPDSGTKPRIGLDSKYRPKIYGKFDMNTTNKMSYKWPKIQRPKAFYPETRLGCGTDPMATKTVQSCSYINPGIVRTISAKCPYVKRPITAPMESTTVVRESYRNPGKATKPVGVNDVIMKYQRKWKLSMKPDYETVHRASYRANFVGRQKNMHPGHNKAAVSAKIGCETTYNRSYMIPGYFVRIKN